MNNTNVTRQKVGFMKYHNHDVSRHSINQFENQLLIIGCPTSSGAQANLTMKINFNILRSFRSSDILTIYLHALLQCSIHSTFEKNCVQGLPRDFRQNNPNTNKKFRWSFSAISHQLSFDVATKEKVRGCQIWWIGGWGACSIRLKPM
jgi:hypothetical protein